MSLKVSVGSDRDDSIQLVRGGDSDVSIWKHLHDKITFFVIPSNKVTEIPEQVRSMAGYSLIGELKEFADGKKLSIFVVNRITRLDLAMALSG